MAKATKTKKAKLTDSEQVNAWMEAQDTPLKPAINLLREIIKNTDPRIAERIKWNAPSYYYLQDIVTFGPRKNDKILIVFHHPHIVNVKSKILEGEFKDRRLAWFDDLQEIKTHQKDLTNILKEMIKFIEKNK